MTPRSNRARVVFDCNVCIAAIASDDGPAASAFRRAEAGDVELFLSKPTLRELRHVLVYPEVLAINPDMTAQRIGDFLERMMFRGTLLRRVPSVFEFPRDPRDEPYIDLAIAARADFLVTRDKDLLSLMAGHSLVCKRFRQKTRPLRVVNPVEFLRAIGT